MSPPTIGLSSVLPTYLSRCVAARPYKGRT